ncbi:transcription initiation factor IIA subunit 2-like [Aegilops tauschii subsp. strangulata]|nr:transcription initiation factor IIA subunit 2-like [Aegilops tauschii subsp. strangulata]
MATEAFEMYRQSEIGYALTETLDEMVSSGVLSPDLAITVLLQFDKSMGHALDKHVKSRVFFKRGNLRTYRNCDDVWTLILRDVTFKNEDIETVLHKVKIVACDSAVLKKPLKPITCHQCQP